ncbi:unnamed protein product [Prunus armeniaca]|uniref:Uncharacterized protein n=1 Tax=Prunus armeniaca TaxID=36596 RepID=A0A6J5TMH1_PRUAR|nr:unnamed protein product [Prunus armeniaca]
MKGGQMVIFSTSRLWRLPTRGMEEGRCRIWGPKELLNHPIQARPEIRPDLPGPKGSNSNSQVENGNQMLVVEASHPM